MLSKVFFHYCLVALFCLNAALASGILEYNQTHDNLITPISNGKSLHQLRKELIINAKESIYLSTFSMSPDKIGKEMVGLLCKRAKEGLEVRVIIDHRANKDLYSATHNLRGCGAFVLHFRPGDRWYAIHEKLLIADGNIVIMGGSGYTKGYFKHSPRSFLRRLRKQNKVKRGWYDKDYQIEGSAACSYQGLFRNNFINLVYKHAFYDHEEYWYGWKNYKQLIPKIYGLGKFKSCEKTNKTGNSMVYATLGNPYKSSSRPILDAHIDSIEKVIKMDDQKNRKITLYAPYFVPNNKWVKAIARALDAGVEVRILTNSIESNDEGTLNVTIFLAMHKQIKGLVKKGLKLFLWTKKSTMHRKGGLYGKVAFFGSDNLDNRGQEYQSESVAFTTDEGVVLEMKNDFNRDIVHSIPLTKEYLKKVKKKSSVSGRFLAKHFTKFF